MTRSEKREQAQLRARVTRLDQRQIDEVTSIARELVELERRTFTRVLEALREVVEAERQVAEVRRNLFARSHRTVLA